MSYITLSKEHGLAPIMKRCFVCGEADNVILLPGAKWRKFAEPGATQPPRMATTDKKPCDKCKAFMKEGVILISVRNPTRRHRCNVCGHTWRAEVQFAKVGEMVNISGEKTVFCPKCNKNGCTSEPMVHESGDNPYRTGCWSVLKEEAAIELFGAESEVLKKRVCFVEDYMWDKIGLPREALDNRIKKEIA